MSRRKDQGGDTPMLDLVASLAGGDTKPDEGDNEMTPTSDAADTEEQSEAVADDPMAGILADAGIAPDVAEVSAESFIASENASEDVEDAGDAPVSADGEDDVVSDPVLVDGDPDAEQKHVEELPVQVETPVVAPPRPAPAKGSASERILLRQNILDVAVDLEAGRIGKRTAVRRIREVCEDDASALDLDDIEVDFDATPEDRSGLSFLAGLGAPKPQPRDIDPVEAALLAAVKLRDRVSALSIVGDTPSAEDRAAYKAALIKLRTALNANLSD